MIHAPQHLRTQYLPLERLPQAALATHAWLSAGEGVELARYADAQRRRQWLAGRWGGQAIDRRRKL